MSRSITAAGRRATIIEVRAITGKLHDLRWRADDWESGIHLAQMRLEIEPHDVKLRQRSIAVVSMHSLARRFERSADRSDAGVLRDLARLAAADPDAMAPGAFSWQVEGGWWVGERFFREVHANQPALNAKPALNVRTFLAADAVDDARAQRLAEAAIA